MQYRSLDEQLFRAMAVLFDQQQRHGVARIVGMRTPVTIVTPTVRKTPANAKMEQSFLKKVYKKLPYALPSTEAQKMIADREQQLVDGMLRKDVEPDTAKRRIR